MPVEPYELRTLDKIRLDPVQYTAAEAVSTPHAAAQSAKASVFTAFATYWGSAN